MESRTIQVEGVGLNVGVTGRGPDLLVLTGGLVASSTWSETRSHRPAIVPGTPNRAVSAGSHTMERSIADLEAIREFVGVRSWIVMGHSWGSDLAVRYAVEHPGAVTAVIGIPVADPNATAPGPRPTRPARPQSPLSTSSGCPRCMRRSAIRSPMGSKAPTCGGDWLTARCRCISLQPRTTSDRPGHSRSLPRSFRAERSQRCQECRTTSGSPIPACGPGPSPTLVRGCSPGHRDPLNSASQRESGRGDVRSLTD